METGKQSGKICTQKEYEQFLSIHQRFKQIVEGPDEFQGDYSYFQTELVHDVCDFWQQLIVICFRDKRLHYLKEWFLDLKSLINTIYDIPMMNPEDGPFRSLADPMRRFRAERNLDSIMVVLNKHFKSTKNKPLPIKKRITFKGNEIFCDEQVIHFGLENCYEVLRNLVKNENHLVPFEELLSSQESKVEAGQPLKDAITKIRKELKPFNIGIPNVRGKGYYITNKI